MVPMRVLMERGLAIDDVSFMSDERDGEDDCRGDDCRGDEGRPSSDC